MNKLQVLMAATLLLVTATGSYAADTVRQITLPTKDLIYDAGTKTIYASVPSRAGSGGNSITPIDPVAGTSGTPVFVGSEPGKMALSDNGQYIYVSLDGAAAVRRYNVAAKASELQFSLGNDNGPNYVEDLAVMPGSPHTIAVSEMSLTATPHHVRVAIFDDGIQRPKTAVGANVIEFGNTPTRLYGYSNEANDNNIFNFTRWNVDSTGIASGDTVANFISGAGIDIKYDNGRIYATNGTVINAEARTLAGTLPAGLVEPDASVNRVFVLNGSDSTYTLHAFDPTTFLEVGSLDITGVNGTPSSLIRWGFNGLAFRTSGDQVFLIQTGLIADVVAPTVAFTFPATGTTETDLSSVSGTASDNVGGSGIDRVTVTLRRKSDGRYWNGTAWVTTPVALATTLSGTAGNQSWVVSDPLPTGGNLLNGIYTFTATAYDVAGNAGTATVSSTIVPADETAPTVTFTTPPSSARLLTFPTIRGAAIDNAGGGGVRRVVLFIQRLSDNRYWTGTTWTTSLVGLSTTLSGRTWSRSQGLPTGANLQSGGYQLFASAYDQANNVGSTSRFIAIDRVGPTLSFLTPTPGSTIISLPVVRGVASDGTVGSGVRRVDLYILRRSDHKYWTGTAWGQMTALTTNLSGTIWSRVSGLPSTTDLQPGTYSLLVVGYDRLGNRSSATINVVKKVSLPPVPRSSLAASSVTADTASSSIRLKFLVALDADSASDPAHYTVQVNGQAVAIESTGYDASTHSVILALPEETLQASDAVIISWSGLTDVSGKSLTGQVGPVQAR